MHRQEGGCKPSPWLIRVEHRWFKARGLASARLRWPAAIRRRWTSGLCSVAAGGPRTRDRLIVAQVMPMDDGPGSFLMIFFCLLKSSNSRTCRSERRCFRFFLAFPITTPVGVRSKLPDGRLVC